MSSRQKNNQTEKTTNILWPVVAVIALACAGWAVFRTYSAPGTQSLKIGFVRSGALLEKVEISASARQKLQTQQDEIQKNVKELEEKLSQAHEAFLKEQKDMTPEGRKAKIKELADQEDKVYQFRQASVQRMEAKQQELFGPVYNIINARIARYAEENGYTMIWGTLSEGNILYGSDPVDLTDSVIKYINSQK